MNRKIVGVPSVPKPLGTNGKLWSQTIDGIELKVFEGTLPYANRIAGVEGEYQYWLKKSTNPAYPKDSLVLVDPSASFGGAKASLVKPAVSSDLLPLLGKAIEVLEKIEENTRKVEENF